MRTPIVVLLSLIAVSSICTAQQTLGPNADAERLALELTMSPPAKRAELLAAHPEKLTVELRRELVQHGNLRFATTQYAQALEIYQLVEQISQQIGDKEGLATSWLNIGSVYYFQGEYQRAIDHYRKAEPLFTALGNRVDAGRCHFGIALTYQAQKKPTEALKEFEAALQEFEAAGNRGETANTLASIGGLQYELGNYEAASKTFLRVADWSPGGESLSRVAEAFYMQHDYIQALAYYERALTYFVPQSSYGGMITAYSGAANCYYYQRSYDRALQYYNRSLTIEQRIGDPVGIATRLQSIGNVHRVRGDYASALEGYLKSLAVAEQDPAEATVATTLGSIGLVRALQGDNVQAVDYFNRSLTAFQTQGDQVGMARMLSYIGNVRYVQGEYDLALDSYRRSLELYGRRGDQLNRAHVLLGIGAVYVAQQKYPPALQSFHEALTLYASLGRKADVADALSRLAAAYRAQGDYAKALEFAQSAAKAAKEAEVFAIVAYALTEAGRAQRGLGHRTEALNAFAEAIQVQRSIRPETGPDGLETDRGGVLPYLGAMETLIDLDQPREALVRAEEAKSQSLRELIQRGNFTITKGMMPAERQEELRLSGELAALKAQVYEAQDSNAKQTTAGNLRSRLNLARSAYEAFRKRLYATHPQLAVNRGELAALNADDLRSLLNRATALIEYVVTEQKVFAFVVTASASDIQVRAYLVSLSRAEIAQKITAFDNSVTAQELYDVLLKPAEAQIGSRSKLIIVPDGLLWDVPFEALKRASVSYAISLSALREMRRRRTLNTTTRTLLTFADPTLTKAISDRVQTTYSGLQIPESSNNNEIEKLLSKYRPTRSRSYTGERASKERVRADVNAAGLLHFATPAILDNSVPMYSFVILSPDPNLGDDGLLKLWEVTNLNSKARLVVLSHTSVAKTSQTGEALKALSWAWFVAGTPAVMVDRGKAGEGRYMYLGN